MGQQIVTELQRITYIYCVTVSQRFLVELRFSEMQGEMKNTQPRYAYYYYDLIP